MTLDTLVNSSKLNALISRLEKKEHGNCCDKTEGYLHSIEGTKRRTLKNIGCSVECGYSYLTAFGDNILTNLCIYLNLWLDEQKRTYFNDNSGITEEEWKIVEKLWNNFETNNIKSKCARKEDAQNISHIKERMKLLTYCINRDYIKKLCEPKMRSGYNISPVCDALYDFIEDHYTTFSKENKCIDYSDEHRDYRYYISDECTLYNMSITFPFIDLGNKAILDNVRPTIKKCEIPSEVEDGNNEPTEDDAVVLPETSEPGNALPEAGIGLTESEVRHSGQEINPDGHPILVLPPSTDASLTDNEPSKSVYYAGLSAIGVFFTSMVLYKYTPLGSFIRSLVSKKEKLRQTTNKHLAQQWLQRTSEYMDPNSENAHYNFPYHNIQNEFPHNR